MEAGERPKVRTTVGSGQGQDGALADAAEGGSTTSAGRADLKTSSRELYSASVMRPDTTLALQIASVVAPMPAWFMTFQIGPDEPRNGRRGQSRGGAGRPNAQAGAGSATVGQADDGMVNPSPCSTDNVRLQSQDPHALGHWFWERESTCAHTFRYKTHVVRYNKEVLERRALATQNTSTGHERGERVGCGRRRALPRLGTSRLAVCSSGTPPPRHQTLNCGAMFTP